MRNQRGQKNSAQEMSFSTQLFYSQKTQNSQSNTVQNDKPITVFMPDENTLWSGGYGNGLSFTLEYSEKSTDENPIIIAKGIDENGQAFEKEIVLKEINIEKATIVEMQALEAHYGLNKGNGLTSLPPMDSMLGLNERANFKNIFQNQIEDMKTINRYDLATLYQELLQSYIDATTKKTTKVSNQDFYTQINDLFFENRDHGEGMIDEDWNIYGVNWEADGTSQLTEEQIEYLKGKYDIENMTKEEYYNLMTELTQMNAISGKDVKLQFARPITQGAVTTSMDTLEYSDESLFEGNILLKTRDEYQYILQAMDQIISGNTQFYTQSVSKVMNDLVDLKDTYGKLQDIFNQLQKD